MLLTRSLLAGIAGLAGFLLASSPASAALILNVPDVVVPTNPPADVVREIDVFFTESAPAENERLQGYNIRIDLDAKTTGVAFVPPGAQPAAAGSDPAPEHPWVFPAGSSFTDFASSGAFIRVAGDTNTPQNVDPGESVVRFSVRIPAGTPDGEYPMSVVDAQTTFVDADGMTFLFPIRQGTVFVGIPEPTGLAVLGLVGGVLALSRRTRRQRQ